MAPAPGSLLEGCAVCFLPRCRSDHASLGVGVRMVASLSWHQPSLFSLSDAIINENYTYLKGFLESLSAPEHSALIQDWDTAGLVFLDYISVIEMLDRIQQVALWRLSGD